jgi:hypothetical protein
LDILKAISINNLLLNPTFIVSLGFIWCLSEPRCNPRWLILIIWISLVHFPPCQAIEGILQTDSRFCNHRDWILAAFTRISLPVQFLRSCSIIGRWRSWHRDCCGWSPNNASILQELHWIGFHLKGSSPSSKAGCHLAVDSKGQLWWGSGMPAHNFGFSSQFVQVWCRPLCIFSRTRDIYWCTIFYAPCYPELRIYQGKLYNIVAPFW